LEAGNEMKDIVIAPNKPLTVALLDPEGQFDLDRGMGTYQTTTGATLTLPRPAVVQLNLIEPRPGEEIEILKSWSGKPKDKAAWFIRLTARSEKARAEAGEPDTLMQQLEASFEAIEERKTPVRVPTPIRKPPKRATVAVPEGQPRLFDRGTGTHGPAPATQPAPLILPAAALIGNRKPGQIPANVAVKEILEFINGDPGTQNWSDQARQDLASTVYIAAVKQGQVGLWERS
jgi:hypothetical protein